MKYSYVLFFFLTASLRSLAQPVLHQNNSFTEGVTINLFNVISPPLNEGSEGTNQTWDFSSLSATDSAVTFHTILASATPYASSFPQADLAVRNINSIGDTIYNYYENDSDVYTSWGIEFSFDILPFTNSKDILHYPFTFGDSFSDTYFYATGYSTNYGNVSVTADGYGTLILPQGSFENCLRVREINRDTLAGDFFVSISNDTSYNFYAVNLPEPLCQVIHHHNQNLNSYSEIYFQDVKPEGIPDGDHKSPFSFPNPCNESLNISFDSGNNFSLIQITDVTGRTFKVSLVNRNNSLQLNTDLLPDGIYFTSVKSGDKTLIIKFVKHRD